MPHLGNSIPVRLRRQWWAVSLLYLLGGGVCFWGVTLLVGFPNALRWGLGASLGMVYILVFLRHGLAQPSLLDDGQLRSLGAANIVTLTRAGLYAGLAGGLFVPMPGGVAAWLPGLIFAAAAATDGLDGYLARRRGQTTSLGQRLDVEVDGFGVLVATALAVRYGQLPEWYLSTGVAYYAYRGLLYAWRKFDRTVVPLPQSTMRRVVGGVQVGFLAVVLLPLVEPPATTIAGVVFATMFFMSFLRDGFIATGLLSADDPSYQRVQGMLQSWFFRKLPVLLRAVVGIFSALLIYRALDGTYTGWQYLLQQGPIGALLTTGWVFVTIVTSAFIVVGAAGRLAALGLLTIICSHVALNGIGHSTTLLLITTLMILILGTGAYSWCRPEDYYLTPRAGSA